MMWLTLSRQLKLSLPIWGRVRAKRGGGAGVSSLCLVRDCGYGGAMFENQQNIL